MSDIKQITNFSLTDIPIPTPIHKKGESTTTTYPYHTITLPNGVFKIGYCCEPKGIGYPIFIKDNISSHDQFEFQIGKTGMLEIQPETWRDINNEEDQEYKTTDIFISKIKVPSEIKFVLDYVKTI